MVKNITSIELKRILGARAGLNTKEFWDNESGRVLYADMDEKTVYNNLEPEELEYITMYYVSDLMEYWAVV